MGRIISARAGFTPRARSGSGSRWDHPRSRGVYPGSSGLGGCASGSSPLARGLQLTDLLLNPLERIIPARAGFTAYQWARLARRADHPRSRGVYAAQGQHLPIQGGSSPLARGLRNPYQRVLPAAGIIPARAGFTRAHRAPPWGSGGSSPLARGLHNQTPRKTRGLRIIPARAGFTRSAPESSPPWRDHPRSRGVYPGVLLDWSRDQGSSPLARGLHMLHGGQWNGKRIIPARAGFTFTFQSSSSLASDHPRSRGVYGPTKTKAGARVRIIPARAGFTS